MAQDELTGEQSRATYYVYRIDLKDGTPVYVGMGGGDLAASNAGATTITQKSSASYATA